jgi:hypothetical protein
MSDGDAERGSTEGAMGRPRMVAVAVSVAALPVLARVKVRLRLPLSAELSLSLIFNVGSADGR